MAIEDENKLKISRRVAIVWVVISLTIGVFIGIVGYSMSKAGAIEVLTGSNSETIIVRVAHLLSTYGAIPAIIGGLILAGMLRGQQCLRQIHSFWRRLPRITESCKRLFPY